MSVETNLCPLTGWDWVGATVKFEGTDPSLSKQGNSYSQMVLQFHLAREWRPYVWRVGVFTLMVMCSTVFAYALDPIDDCGDR